MIAGVILAAGESSRMGRDKALLAYHDTTFLDHLLDLFLPRVSPVVLVLGHNAGRIMVALHPRPGLQIAVNEQYKLGQLSSLQAGIRALPPEAQGALVTLVDHPAVAPATLDAILARWNSERPPLVIPRYRERRGHPVLFSRELLDDLAVLPATASAREVVHAHLSEDACVDVDDPGILRDIDTSADYENLRKEESR